VKQKWLNAPNAVTRAENILRYDDGIIGTVGEFVKFLEFSEYDKNILAPLNETVVRCSEMSSCAIKVNNLLVEQSPCDAACKESLWTEIRSNWEFDEPFPDERRAPFNALNLTLDNFRRIAMVYLYRIRHEPSTNYSYIVVLLHLILPNIEANPTKALFWELTAQNHNLHSHPLQAIPSENLLKAGTVWPEPFVKFLRYFSGSARASVENWASKIKDNTLGDQLFPDTVDRQTFDYSLPGPTAALMTMLWGNMNHFIVRELKKPDPKSQLDCK